jgi:hypothetical protein
MNGLGSLSEAEKKEILEDSLEQAGLQAFWVASSRKGTLGDYIESFFKDARLVCFKPSRNTKDGFRL